MKKTLVDCDSIFDILTRGPFPPVDDQQDVEASQIESHLARCYECRQLAEALRPSVSLIHEMLSEEERATLPTFNDAEMIERLHRQIIEAVFETENDPERNRRINRACEKWLAPAMVLVPILAVTALMFVIGNPDLSAGFSNVMATLPHRGAGDGTRSPRSGIPAECLVPMAISAKSTETPNSISQSNFTTNRVTNRCVDCHRSITDGGASPHNRRWHRQCSECHQLPRHGERAMPIDTIHFHCCTTCHTAGHEDTSVDAAAVASACATCHN